jgi:hypothetical protein
MSKREKTPAKIIEEKEEEYIESTTLEPVPETPEVAMMFIAKYAKKKFKAWGFLDYGNTMTQTPQKKDMVTKHQVFLTLKYTHLKTDEERNAFREKQTAAKRIQQKLDDEFE